MKAGAALMLAGLFLLTLTKCSKGPCPRGQELRELTFPSRAVKERGCMEKDDDGSYRRQGKWEFFAESGWKAMEVAFKDGEKDGLQTEWFSNGEKMLEVTFADGEKGPVTFWDKNGIKLDQAPLVGVTLEDGSIQVRPVEPR